MEKAGKLIFKGEKPKTETEKAALGNKILFSPDAVHPYTDSGHQLYFKALVRSLAGKPAHAYIALRRVLRRFRGH